MLTQFLLERFNLHFSVGVVTFFGIPIVERFHFFGRQLQMAQHVLNEGFVVLVDKTFDFFTL